MALIPAVCAANCGPALAGLVATIGIVPVSVVGGLTAAGVAFYRNYNSKGGDDEEVCVLGFVF